MSDSFERRLDGRRVFEGRVVALDVDTVALSDGSESEREVIRHAGAAVILPIDHQGRLVFVRQYRYPVAEQLLELPAGTLEPGEDAASCAARELAEETGVSAGELEHLGSFFSTPGFTDEELYAVLARDLRPAEGFAPDPDEVIETVTMTVSEALDKVRSGEIRDAKTMATLLLAKLRGIL